MKKLKKIYHRQAFYPGFLGLFVNPFYFARAGLAHAMKELSCTVHGRLLDIGCGSKPYKELFNVEEYIGLDIDSEVSQQRAVADFFYDGGEFPFNSCTYDAALCNQVLEHVFTPDCFLKEVHRVLKPQGKLLLTVPFVWDEHEQPFDFARYSSFGLRALLERNGFRVLMHDKLSADATVLFQMTNAYLYKITQKWPRYLRMLLTITVMAAINIFGIVVGRLLPRNQDLFLDQVILAEKVS